MKRRVWQITFILLGSLTIGIGFGQGCSRPFSAPSGTSDGSSTAADANDSGYQINPDAETLSMVYNKQVLDHLVSCAGVGIPSDETLATWTSKRGAVSIDGTVLTITAPMLMAVTTISGDVCRDLITQEKTSPRLFNNVNWSATALPSDTALRDSIRGLALSCWQRPEEDLEQQIVMDAVRSEFTTGTINVSDAYLFLCTSMLSSLDTLTL